MKTSKIRITTEQRKRILAAADPNSGITMESVNALSRVLESSMNKQAIKVRKAAVESAQKSARIKLRAAIKRVRNEMAQKIDGYLTHVVESWAKSNAVALKQTVESVKNRKILNTVSKLLGEMNVKVPSVQKTAVVKLSRNLKLANRIAESRKSKILQLRKEIRERKQAAIVTKEIRGMTSTQKERVVEMAKALRYTDMPTWSTRVKRIAESVRNKSGGTGFVNRKPSRAVIESRLDPRKNQNDVISGALGIISSTRKN
jgi:hypothetical protein